MQIVSREVQKVAPFADEDWQLRDAPLEHWRKLAPRGFIDEHGTHAVPRILQHTPDDNAALGDEQTLRAQTLRVGHLPKGGNARILGPVNPLDGHQRS